MSEHLLNVETDIHETVERLAEETSAAFKQFWLDRGEHETDYDLGKVDEGEYYRSVQLVTDTFEASSDYHRLLANFEIHRGGEPSPEFRLLGEPMISELTGDLALIENPDQLDYYLRELEHHDENAPVFIGRFLRVKDWHDKDPRAFKRLLLTRELGHYGPVKAAMKVIEDFLRQMEEYPEFFKEYSDQDKQELRAHNSAQLLDKAVELEMTEKMVREGVTPLTPEEYHDRVKTYLLGLIKAHEARLNPVLPDTSLPRMEGSIAIQSFFESRTGTDFPLPKNS